MAGYRNEGAQRSDDQRIPGILGGEATNVDPVVVVAPRPARPKPRPNFYVGHPSTLESFIPVWGSGREALADFQDGDVAGGVFNGLLAISDLIPAEASANALRKGAFKGGSHSWPATREWMKKNGYLEKGIEGHHWLIPQNGWGKAIPESIKNQPWNIKALPKVTHRRIHTRFLGEARYHPAQRYWYATPTWSKAASASLLGHPLSALTSEEE